MPKGFRDMKRELENKQQQGESNQSQNQWNLSLATLEAYAENKRKVDAGLLPKYIGGSIDPPSNPDLEHSCKRVIDFANLINPKIRRSK
jgi:hypothetical protein